MQAVTDDRNAIYRRLERRNRRVAIWRLALPVAGAIVFGVLAIRIVIFNAGSGYDLAEVSELPDRITVEAPEYQGVLEGGAHYRVWAGRAEMLLADPGRIALEEAGMRLERPGEPTMEVAARAADFETNEETVIIPGAAEISDETGTTGVLENTIFDWSSRYLSSGGPVSIEYADGTTLRAGGLEYDLGAGIWTFSDVTVTLPDTPGAEPAEPSGAAR